MSRNLLFVERPDLQKEWSYNNKLDPKTITAGSHKKALWICAKCGSEWEAVISSRAIAGNGCPVCAKLKRAQTHHETASKFSESFVKRAPYLLKEWDFHKNQENPWNISYGSTYKYWWICKNRHSWMASVNNRTKGNGCPYCSNRYLLTGENDLLTKYPNIAEEWDNDKNDLSPSEVIAKSKYKAFWICNKCGHRWQTTVAHRTSAKTGCPECNRVFQTSFPEKAIAYYLERHFGNIVTNSKQILDGKYELDIFIPEILTAIEYDGIAWHKKKSSKKREQAKYNLCLEKNIKLIRVSEKEDNQYCDIYIKSDYNNLEYSKLDKVIKNTFLALNCECSNPINSEKDRIQIEQLYMSDIRERSLTKKYPLIAKSWSKNNLPVSPEMVYPHSIKKYLWICNNCGKEHKATIRSMTRNYDSDHSNICFCEECRKKIKNDKISRALKGNKNGSKHK